MKKLNLFISIILFLFSHFCITLAQTQLVQYGKFTGSHRAEMMFYGEEMDMSEHYCIVGAYGDDLDENGENYISDAGAAYIYRYDLTGSLDLEQKLVAPERKTSWFGESVSITDDYALVGAYRASIDTNGVNYSGAGEAHLYKRDATGNWNHVQRLLHSDIPNTSNFGREVRVHDNWLFVYAWYRHETRKSNVSVFRILPNDSAELVQVLDPYDSDLLIGLFGDEIDMHGDNLIITTSGGLFFLDGDYYDDKGLIHYYTLQSDTFVEVQRMATGESGSLSIPYSISVHENTMVVGGPGVNYDPDSLVYLVESGAIFIYELNTGSGLWERTNKIVPSERRIQGAFGQSVFINEDFISVGMKGNCTDGSGGSFVDFGGGGYLFRKDPAQGWIEECKFVANDRNDEDELGHSIVNRGDIVIIASPYIDSDEVGGNLLNSAGAAYLFGPALPEILVHPENLSLCEGDPVQNLGIEARGLEVEAQWYKDEMILENETSNTLAIQTLPANSGSYFCLAWNEYDTISSDTVTVHIGAQTEIISDPSDITDCEGSGSEILSVLANGEDLAYQWYLDDEPQTGEVDASIEIARVPASNGTYHCVVEGSCGTDVSADAIVDITGLISLSDQSDDQAGCIGGDPFMLFVETEGDVVSYTWQGNDTIYSLENSYLMPCLAENEGIWVGIVLGECNDLVTEAIELTVNDTLAILSQPESVQVEEGMAASLSITATGDEITYQWYQDEVLLMESDNILGVNTNTLVILAIGEDNAGSYTCTMTNPCGELVSEEASIEISLSLRQGHESSILLYPNPVTGGVLYLEDPEPGMCNIELTTLSGSKLLQKVLYTENASLDIPELPAGLYYIRITSEDSSARYLIAIP